MAGRFFNKNGEKIDGWWSNETSAGFSSRSQCMVDQYSRYSLDIGDGKTLNVSTIRENLLGIYKKI